MRKNLTTLITLLCLTTALLNTAYAGNANRHHHHRVKAVRTIDTYRTTTTYLEADSVSADSVMQFAQSLIGTRYRPATSDPLLGFDCSGFVSYVFKNFNLNVPRSSCEFINVGEKIRLEDAKPGDIILFTSPTNRHRIGHVGIVFYNGADDFKFIHSTSGKEYGVTISSMDETYKRRFVQVVRLLKQNNDAELASE